MVKQKASHQLGLEIYLPPKHFSRKPHPKSHTVRNVDITYSNPTKHTIYEVYRHSKQEIRFNCCVGHGTISSWILILPGKKPFPVKLHMDSL